MHCACALMCVYSLTGAWWSPGKEGGSGCCRGSCSGRRRASFNNSTRFLSCPLQSKISLFAKFLHFSNGFPRLTHTNIALPEPEIIAQYFCQDQTGVRTAQYVGWQKKNKSPMSRCFSLFSLDWLLHQRQLCLLKFLRSQFVPKGSSGEDSRRPNNCICDQMSSGCIQSHNVDVQDVCVWWRSCVQDPAEQDRARSKHEVSVLLGGQDVCWSFLLWKPTDIWHSRGRSLEPWCLTSGKSCFTYKHKNLQTSAVSRLSNRLWFISFAAL